MKNTINNTPLGTPGSLDRMCDGGAPVKHHYPEDLRSPEYDCDAPSVLGKLLELSKAPGGTGIIFDRPKHGSCTMRLSEDTRTVVATYTDSASKQPVKATYQYNEKLAMWVFLGKEIQPD